jgi:hypothetical protein
VNGKIYTIALVIFAISLLLLGSLSPNKETFEERRASVLNGLYLAIDDAISEGKYECCIEPPCTMCYMGNWIWDDGTCKCDELMKEGRFDEVCPQCIKGLEEGRCKSADETKCEVRI